MGKIVSANVSKLKLHLGKYLKMVRSGRDVIVLDRSTPVAKLVPYTDDAPGALSVKSPVEDAAGLSTMTFEPVAGDATDSLRFLMDERRERGA